MISTSPSCLNVPLHLSSTLLISHSNKMNLNSPNTWGHDSHLCESLHFTISVPQWVTLVWVLLTWRQLLENTMQWLRGRTNHTHTHTHMPHTLNLHACSCPLTVNTGKWINLQTHGEVVLWHYRNFTVTKWHSCLSCSCSSSVVWCSWTLCSDWFNITCVFLPGFLHYPSWGVITGAAL